jgi:tagaturonate reductase
MDADWPPGPVWNESSPHRRITLGRHCNAQRGCRYFFRSAGRSPNVVCESPLPTSIRQVFDHECAYDRHALPERVLQFGTGALLRAVSAVAVDTANRAGVFNGRIVVVQSTRSGVAQAINAQDGLFTLVEQGVADGERVQRSRVIGSMSRALIADDEWQLVRDVISRPDLQVVVSNVTEAGFRLAEDEPGWDRDRSNAPPSFPAKLTDLLFTRFTALGNGALLYIVPTELLPGNGPLLGGMIDVLARRYPDADVFRDWIARRVRFCSSLVDRITTGGPSQERRAELESQLGYHDALLTVTEPYSLWAIEADPVGLHDAFPVDAVSNGTVTFKPDIDFYRLRKLRLLNGAHTALAPLALMNGVRTVREAAAHPVLGPFLRLLVSDEIGPITSPASDVWQPYATSIVDRLGNPWLDHEWQVIATNQVAKLRIRVLPSILDCYVKQQRLPRRLLLALAASLRYSRITKRLSSTSGWGWWRGAAYPIVDVETDLVNRYWRSVDPAGSPGAVPVAVLAAFATSVLGDAEVWGRDLTAIPGLAEAVIGMLLVLEQDGIDAAVFLAAAPHPRE